MFHYRTANEGSSPANRTLAPLTILNFLAATFKKVKKTNPDVNIKNIFYLTYGISNIISKCNQQKIIKMAFCILFFFHTKYSQFGTSSVCSTTQFGPVTFQEPNGHRWPMAAILDSTSLGGDNSKC